MKMKKYLSEMICSALTVFCLIAYYGSKAAVFHGGVKLMLPVTVESVEKDAFSSIARIRYENFIPVPDLTSDKGVLVVRRMNDGRAEFVSAFDGRELQSSELLLKYSIRQPFNLKNEDARPLIRFSALKIRFPSSKKVLISAVQYAVVYVDAFGNASLAELSDSSGVPLISGIGFSMFRTL